MQQGFRAAKIREKQVQFLLQKVPYDVINAGCKRIGFKFLLILEGLFCCLCWCKIENNVILRGSDHFLSGPIERNIVQYTLAFDGIGIQMPNCGGH